MTQFIIEQHTDRPDRVFVEINRRFDVAIIRTDAGLVLEIYPRTDGELWVEPFTTFTVNETEIIDLEGELTA